MDRIGIGQKIKALRKSQGISLLQLANHIGKTKSYISMIENGKANPSLATLKDITSFFGLDLATFFETEENRHSPEKEIFTFGEDARLIYSQKKQYNLYLLISNTQLKMKTYLVELFPEGGYSQALKHDGEEYGYVLEGEIELALDGEQFSIKKGGYFYFDSSRKHIVRNLSASVSKVQWIYLPD